MNEKRTGIINACIAALTVLAVMIVTGICFDYYLDLNDDVYIRAITSGAFTGIPEAHNIQMLYPLGLLLSTLYRLSSGTEWYSLFLAAVQYACLGILLYGALTFLHPEEKDKRVRRIVTYILVVALLLTLLYPHLVILQYTVSCAMCAGTAAFLFLTAKQKSGFVTGVVLTIIAFLIRSEMLLLTLPLIALTLIYRLYLAWKAKKGAGADAERTLGESVPLKTLLILCAVLVAGLAVSYGWHTAAYASDDWKEFVRLFDNRTELYDFHAVPTYAEDQEFFDEAGLSEAESFLLTNYNYGLDGTSEELHTTEKIDADFLGRAAQYMTDKEKAQGADDGRFLRALSNYFYRIKYITFPSDYAYPQTDAPWNLLAILLYLAVILLYMIPEEPKEDEDGYVALISISRAKTVFPEVLLLLLVRTALWLFLLYRGRDPIRVTHGLYFVEIAMLFGFLLHRIHILLGIEVAQATAAKMPKTKRRRGADGKKLPLTVEEADKQKRWSWENVSKVRSFRVAMLFLLVMFTISFLSTGIVITSQELQKREATNADYDALFAQIHADDSRLYLLDVYSFTTYSEKAFRGDSAAYKNEILLGGWMSKSPLEQKKLQSLQEGLLTESAYYVARPTDVSKEHGDADNTGWLIDYYAAKGITVTAEAVSHSAGDFVVYRITRQ